MSIQGKKAFVTGGTRGIGRNIAEVLAEAGADVAIVGTDFGTANKTAVEIAKQYKVNTFAVEADVSNPEQVDNLGKVLMGKFGRLDIAVNNAGVCSLSPAETMHFKEFKRIMDVNLNGVFLTAQAAAKLMIPNKSGSIINIGSISGHIINVPQPAAHYMASKAGVIHLTKALAVEWAKYNIRVNSISPGYIGTELVAAMNELHPLWLEKIPMGRLGKPEELKALALFLASPASSYCTGTDVLIDCGYTSA
jgi:NAD(P)-dependent dehydrogenase (short-subunit alcohol dehydrogenase family)